MDLIRKSLNEAKDLLNEFIAGDKNISSIEAAGKLMVKSLKNKGKLIAFGNGGSMCDAMHFAEELTGRFRDDRPAIPAVSISDPSHITCVANDYGFDQVFSRYIEANGHREDTILAISTSGNSRNIILACQTAKEKGMGIVALTGKTGGILSSLADVEIRVPHMGYSDRIQEIHIKIIHILIEYIEKEIINSGKQNHF
jgi:D-sedoheptulose 7-phosphate isomerase